MGSIGLIGTMSVVADAAGTPGLPDRDAMRALYGRMRALDDGLPPIEGTHLLSAICGVLDSATANHRTGQCH